jgi:hypothetical protein
MLSDKRILKLFQMLFFRYKSRLCQSTSTEMFGFMARVAHDEPSMSNMFKLCSPATVNQYPPVHHPLDACYYSVLDEPQLS